MKPLNISASKEANKNKTKQTNKQNKHTKKPVKINNPHIFWVMLLHINEWCPKQAPLKHSKYM